jgi:hypothetical protein
MIEMAFYLSVLMGFVAIPGLASTEFFICPERQVSLPGQVPTARVSVVTSATGQSYRRMTSVPLGSMLGALSSGVWGNRGSQEIQGTGVAKGLR